MAPVKGIVGARVGVDRGEEDGGILVEDVLGPVAVVIVDVEDRDRAEAAVLRRARRDRGVVEVAIAAHIVAAGMMAGRAAEREGVARIAAGQLRSEEHTSQLQSLMRNSYAVFCLKKKTKHTHC